MSAMAPRTLKELGGEMSSEANLPDWPNFASELLRLSTCISGDDATQANQTDDVRKHLEAVHQVAPGPHEFGLHDGAERNQQAVDVAIRQGHRAAQDVLEKLLTVVRPANQRRIPEQERTH